MMQHSKLMICEVQVHNKLGGSKSSDS